MAISQTISADYASLHAVTVLLVVPIVQVVSHHISYKVINVLSHVLMDITIYLLVVTLVISLATNAQDLLPTVRIVLMDISDQELNVF